MSHAGVLFVATNRDIHAADLTPRGVTFTQNEPAVPEQTIRPRHRKVWLGQHEIIQQNQDTSFSRQRISLNELMRDGPRVYPS